MRARLVLPHEFTADPGDRRGVARRDRLHRQPAPGKLQGGGAARRHNCINLRLPTRGGLYAWEFEKDGRELKVHVEGQLVFNGTFQMLDAALAGFGLAYVPQDVAAPHLAKGRLKRVLEDWCPPYPGYHLYYPTRRQLTPAFHLLVDTLLPDA